MPETQLQTSVPLAVRSCGIRRLLASLPQASFVLPFRCSFWLSSLLGNSLYIGSDRSYSNRKGALVKAQTHRSTPCLCQTAPNLAVISLETLLTFGSEFGSRTHGYNITKSSASVSTQHEQMRWTYSIPNSMAS